MKKLSLKNSDTLTVDEAFEDFKGHCRVKNLSGETIKLYQYQFNVFHRFLNSVVKEYVQMFGNDLSVNFDKFNPLDRTVSPNSCKKIAMAK